MKIAIYSSHTFEKEYIIQANNKNHELIWIENTLVQETIDKAKDCEAVFVFSSDSIDEKILKNLSEIGVSIICTRSAGTDHIDLKAASKYNIKITNVPEYSPSAIAEHCIALVLTLYRKLKPTFKRIDNYNFSLNGLVGTEISSKTIGICGTGDIGEVLANLFYGFNTEILLFDSERNSNLKNKKGVKYVDKNTLINKADIISLNLPLNDKTKHFICAEELKKMKNSAILINTGRGELVNTKHVKKALDDKEIKGFAMDVYAGEKGIFYDNKSKTPVKKRDKLLTSFRGQ